MNLPEKPGVYKIKQEDKLLYIGQSKNIKKRCQQHSLTNPDDVEVDYEIVEHKEARIALESKLISEHNPSHNKQDKQFRQPKNIFTQGNLDSEDISLVNFLIDKSYELKEQGKDKESLKSVVFESIAKVKA